MSVRTKPKLSKGGPWISDMEANGVPASSAMRPFIGGLKYTVGLIIVYNIQQKTLVSQILLTTYGVGYSALFVGICIRNSFPRLSNIFLELGVDALVTVFHGVIAWHLPLYLTFVTFLFWLAAVLAVRHQFSSALS